MADVVEKVGVAAGLKSWFSCPWVGDDAMMGKRTVVQEALFNKFNLERQAPADHLIRGIDRVVDLAGTRTHLRPSYSETAGL